jgi:branched-chain amino acid transport system permease protein
VNLAQVKVGAFAISAAYAGIAGSLSVMIEGSASASDPTIAFRNSIEFLVAVVIGGTATIAGPAIGALVLVLLRKYSGDLVEGTEVLAPAVFGGLLIAMVFVLPGGFVGGLRSLADRVLPIKDGEAPPPSAAALAPAAVAEAVADLDATDHEPPSPPTKETP